MSSLELFAREVMPEFQAREDEQQAWKQAVLAGDARLDEIDTEPFNVTARLKPTLPPSEEALAAARKWAS